MFTGVTTATHLQPIQLLHVCSVTPITKHCHGRHTNLCWCVRLIDWLSIKPKSNLPNRQTLKEQQESYNVLQGVNHSEDQSLPKPNTNKTDHIVK